MLVGKRVFAIIGGYGYHVIRDFVDHSFSIKIIERTFDETSPVFKNIRERGMVGNVIGSSKIYRNTINIATESDVGKMIEKAVTTFDKGKLEDFGLCSKKGCTCFAGSGFKLSTSITFEETKELCDRLNKRLDDDPIMTMTFLEEVRKKQEIKELNEQLYERIRDLASGKDVEFDFYFTSRDIYEFVVSDSIEIKFGGKTIVGDLMPTNTGKEVIMSEGVKGCLNKLKNVEEVGLILSKLKVYFTVNNEEESISQGSLIEHLHGELKAKIDGNMGERLYFYLNGKWYYINEDLVETVNNYVEKYVYYTGKHWLKKFNEQKLRRSYKKKNKENQREYLEKEYNESHEDCSGVIVADCVFYDGKEKVELCDLMKIDDENGDVELVQVKISFGAEITKACEQIIASASVLQRWRNKASDSTKKSIEEYHNKIIESYQRGSSSAKPVISYKALEKALLEYKVHYTLAFVDEKKGSGFDIKESNSLLAKIGIMNAQKNVVSNNFDMKLVWIEKVNVGGIAKN
jgi:uncharacterized protein (TIGR04141 family)